MASKGGTLTLINKDNFGGVSQPLDTKPIFSCGQGFM